MNDNTAYFHFTLGPVQSFVAQARRTRDFWAGSFILSWLAGVAMREVIAQAGNDRDAILFPKPEPTFLGWLDGTRCGMDGPEQGSIPNRFKARVDLDKFNPADVVTAVTKAWQALADTVYEQDFGRLAVTKRPDRALWDRQIKATWEMHWSITDDNEDSAILDQRKNWRSYAPPEQPGVKCMMMDGWQELSGVPTPNEDSLKAFWEPLRQSSNTLQSDVREKEYLCAIAFVKRRFPRHFDKLPVTTMPGGWSLHGWKVDEGRPSVSYMAAVHWLENIIIHANNSAQVEECLWAFHDAAYRLTQEHGAWGNDIRCIRDAKPHRKWEALDGDVFFESVLENTNLYTTPEKQAQAKTALQQLRRLQQVSGLGRASPFYAVLMMDGDSLGKQMKEQAKQAAITVGLQTFTSKVPALVDEHSGFLIYAGGDDVLAVLPTENALACALAIREHYMAIFSAYADKQLTTSISAAIEFAHIRMPLTKVLRDAHHLLDDIAKEQCGRDALAVRVWKPGGKALEWAMRWDQACDTSTGAKRLVVERLSKAFKEDLLRDDDPQGQFSNKFFYKIRERLELFNPAQDGDPAHALLDAQTALDLMAAEYVVSGAFDKSLEKRQRLEHAKAVVKPLLEQCMSRGRYRADGALLVRFLAQKEVV